jgi:hypothetical protein
MRYRPGSIEVSPTEDEPILRLALHSRFITHEQLIRFLQIPRDPVLRNTFNWRVTRLVRHELLQSHTPPTLGRTRIYSASEAAADHLAGTGEFCELTPGRAKPEETCRLLHSLELNEIHLALKEAGVLIRWRTETAIRSRNELTRAALSKDYDAVVSVRIGAAVAEFALEYERTAKTKSRYLMIRRRLEEGDEVPQVLYLASNFHLLETLMDFLAGSRRTVWFGLFADFRSSLLDMSVYGRKRLHRVPLRSALLA